MRVLIVSLGSIGRRHLANLRSLVPDVEAAVWHQRTSRTDVPQGDGARHLFSQEEALAFAPQAAIVCSPAPFHLHNALALAGAGAHLLVEKPLSHQTDGVDALLAACRERGVRLLVGYHLRFEPSLRALRDALGTGVAGRPLHLRAEVGQYLPDWRAGADYRTGVTAQAALGGGVLLELSHELDYARWLLGEAEAISAQTARLGGLDIDVEDTADIQLRFASGAVGSVHLDMVRRTPVRRCEVVCSDGTLTWDGLGRTASFQPPGAAEPRMLYDGSGQDRNGAYLAEMAHFLDCAQGRAEPLVSEEDGLGTLALVEAARRSDREGRTVQV
jgi:predicted dehydrogenase